MWCDFMLYLQFLDHLMTYRTLSNPKKNTTYKPLADKIYNKSGEEITDVNSLEYNQEIWLSFGEPWIDPSSTRKAYLYDMLWGFVVILIPFIPSIVSSISYLCTLWFTFRTSISYEHYTVECQGLGGTEVIFCHLTNTKHLCTRVQDKIIGTVIY